MLAAERGLVPGTGRALLITRGASRPCTWWPALVRPGDRGAVEAFGYPLAWAALRAAGAELVPIDVDTEGLRPDQVEDAAREGLRAVYLTPHHQFPTMVTLTAARRLALLELAAEHGFAVIEDDYDNEFHFRGRPVLPLAARDERGSVIYVGTLSKTLAPWLRRGFVVAPTPVIEAVHVLRVVVDRQRDLATEYALALLVEDGTLPRHLRRVRKVYAARRRVLAEALRGQLGARVRFEVPAGGLARWVGARATAPGAWSRRALAHGVRFETGRRLQLQGQAGPCLRLHGSMAGSSGWRSRRSSTACCCCTASSMGSGRTDARTTEVRTDSVRENQEPMGVGAIAVARRPVWDAFSALADAVMHQDTGGLGQLEGTGNVLGDASLGRRC